MGDLSEFAAATRVFLRAYPWRRNDPVPWTSLARPLAEARVALVTSAALVLPGQEPFDEGVRGGDPSYRVLPGDLDVSRLREHMPARRVSDAAVDGSVGRGMISV